VRGNREKRSLWRHLAAEKKTGKEKKFGKELGVGKNKPGTVSKNRKENPREGSSSLLHSAGPGRQKPVTKKGREHKKRPWFNNKAVGTPHPASNPISKRSKTATTRGKEKSRRGRPTLCPKKDDLQTKKGRGGEIKKSPSTNGKRLQMGGDHPTQKKGFRGGTTKVLSRGNPQ